MSQFRGLFPAAITPLTADGKVYEKGLRQYLEFNIQAGVHGFWLAGGTGESVLLDDEDNRRVAGIAADQNGGRIVNIMHVGAATTARACALAEHAADVGCESICAVPPFFYTPSDDQVVEHYKAVGAAAGLPLFLYNLPAATNVDFTPAVVQRLRDEVPQLQGLKHSSPNFGNARVFAEMGLDCFIGSATLMLPALTVGCCGLVDGPPAFAPELWLDVWQAYQARDLRGAEAAQRRALDVYGLFTSDYLATMKYIVGLRIGLDLGGPKETRNTLTDEAKAELRSRVEALKLEAVTPA